MNTRTPIVWVWKVFRLIHCQKGMHVCAYISLKLIELEVKCQLKKHKRVLIKGYRLDLQRAGRR